jgi:two-component system sensor histidine kinase KdpD
MEGKQKTDRPDPEALLKKIQKENRGKLTVFLGAIAGVGKTFAMLKTAHEQLAEGKNIIIGWIETHGRVETENLVKGLPRVDPLLLCYHNNKLLEMDIDAILALRPEIVLVDELAHTNIPGSRHVRRYQDVEELLAAGIHVYTTVNVQHIESLNDIVAQITGVTVRETVPDYVIEKADAVQLIDIDPEKLIQRLRDGKIYIPEQARKALQQFFRQGNISALRELSLRFTAQRVDKDLSEYMNDHNIEGPWPAAGRVMVCLSGSPFSAQLIRAANRLATGLRSELLAVHIEAEKMDFPMGDKERDCLARNMRLAEDLGAKTLTVVGANIVDEMLLVARKQNITAIVVGKPNHRKISYLFGGSLVDKIIRRCGNINVYVIPGTKEVRPEANQKNRNGQAGLVYNHLCLSLMMVGIVTAFGWWLQEELEVLNIAFLYILPVLLSALWWGKWASYLSAVTGMLALDFYFIEPIMTFSIGDVRYIWSFIIFLLLSALIGGRTDKLKKESRQARQQEKSTRAVYEFSRDIAAVIDMASIANSLVRQAGETIEHKIVVLLPDEKGSIKNEIRYDPLSNKVNEKMQPTTLSDAESAVVAWVYKNRQAAGRSTDTLPGGDYLYVPIYSQTNVFAVLGIDLAKQKLTPSERRLIDAWIRLSAVAMEKVSLAEKARRTDTLIEADKLRAALFSSISHELKTPLSAILGSVSSLLEADDFYNKQDRLELLSNIKDSSLRMERLIANLLDTARMESGMMKLKTDWCDIEDIIGATLRRLGDLLKNHHLTVDIDQDLPFVKGDCVLIEQVLVNLFDNAIKYSEKQSEIIIRVRKIPHAIEIAILDEGVGIPQNDLEKIFSKFYRVKQPKKISGTGLGLSICKGIVEAHKGKITALNRSLGGTMISFTLPIETDENEKKQSI